MAWAIDGNVHVHHGALTVGTAKITLCSVDSYDHVIFQLG